VPIKPEFRKFYGKEWRTVTRPRILARAKNLCEQCGVPNHAKVWRSGIAWSRRKFKIARRRIRIVLTIAHMNHTPGDDRDENLKALCQWCHLNYDQAHHRESRAARKDASRPLFASGPPTEN
jgi:hypothetical protein